MRRGHSPQRQHPQNLVRQRLRLDGARPVRVQQIREHVPRARRRERLLMLRRHAHQMVRSLRDVLHHPRMHTFGPRPRQPVPGAAHQVNVHHPVHQRRRHRPDDRSVLAAVARADHHRLRMQPVPAQPPLQDQAVERLLHLMTGGVQLVQEQHERLVPGDVLRRAEPRTCRVPLPHDPRHPDQILGRQLRPQQRLAGQPHLPGEVLHQTRLADPRLPPHEHRPAHRHVQQHLRQLGGGHGHGGMHGTSENTSTPSPAAAQYPQLAP